MAIQLFRLAGTSPAASDTKYFYTLSDNLTVAALATAKLTKTKWVKGNGSAVSATGSFAMVPNGYYRLCINGVLQQSAIFTVVVASSVHIIASAAAMSIKRSAPLTLEAQSFTPAVVAVP